MGADISFAKHPQRWMALHVAGESNLYVGIVQLKRIGFTAEDIKNLVRLLLTRT